MNMKLIITGLVALGLVGQITGQTSSEPDGIPTTESFTSESWSIEGLVNPLDATGETTAKIKVRGKERLYQCEDGRIPPNCNFADPPIEINQCGAWKHIFHVNYGVTCPPDFPTQMIYWVERCSGGYSEIARWNINWRGNCQRGYEAFNGLLEGESPDCARGQPDAGCSECPDVALPVTVTFAGVNPCGPCVNNGASSIQILDDGGWINRTYTLQAGGNGYWTGWTDPSIVIRNFYGSGNCTGGFVDYTGNRMAIQYACQPPPDDYGNLTLSFWSNIKVFDQIVHLPPAGTRVFRNQITCGPYYDGSGGTGTITQ